MKNEVIEDYLKAIFVLQKEKGKVGTNELAKKMGIAAASATGMIKKLSEKNLVTYEPYQGVKLTESGKRIAGEVIRHHRLIELFLSESLGVPWDKVHEEAEKWEHVLSEDLEDRIDELLGFPTTDPHGAPIPDRNGKLTPDVTIPLSDLRVGQSAIISEVNDDNSELLRYLGKMGFYPKIKIMIVKKAPFEGPIEIKLDDMQHSIGSKVASQILVTRVQS
jgi:DtxR family Mn-dependent transcriptional regulator